MVLVYDYCDSDLCPIRVTEHDINSIALGACRVWPCHHSYLVGIVDKVLDCVPDARLEHRHIIAVPPDLDKFRDWDIHHAAPNSQAWVDALYCIVYRLLVDCGNVALACI